MYMTPASSTIYAALLNLIIRLLLVCLLIVLFESLSFISFLISDDILNVRLQTLGIAEHRYDINLGGTRYNWLMYDVGGAVRLRSYRIPRTKKTDDLYMFPARHGSCQYAILR